MCILFVNSLKAEATIMNRPVFGQTYEQNTSKMHTDHFITQTDRNPDYKCE